MISRRHWAFWSGLAGFLLAGAGWAAESVVPVPERIDDTAARLMYARVLSYRRQTWEQSAAEYETVLQRRPNDADALAGLGELRLRQGNFGAAEKRLNAALAQRPADPAAVASLARVYLATRRPEQALDLLQSAARQRPGTPDEQMLDAEAQVQLGRAREAATALDRLQRATPSPSAELLVRAADAQLAAGSTAAARDLYGRALAADPTDAGAQRGYALTLQWTGRAGPAKPRLEAWLKTHPDDGDAAGAYLDAVNQTAGAAATAAVARERAEAAPRDAARRADWAEAENRLGHAVRARALFAEALALEDTPALRRRAAEAAVTWGDFNGAERVFRAALRAQPDDDSLRDQLGRLLTSADRLEEAEQFYDEWLARAPAAEAAESGRLRVALKAKRYADALDRADALQRDHPQSTEALIGKAQALTALGRIPEAERVQQELAQQPGTRAAADVALANFAQQRHDVVAAAAALVAAREAAPDAMEVRFAAAGPAVATDAFLASVTPVGAPPARCLEAAGCYAQRGDFPRAVECLRAALRSDPEYYPARAQLAEFLAIAGNFDAALPAFAALKAEMPANRQVLLGEARALAWARRYDEALKAYGALAALNPADPVPRREAARTANWAKQRARSAELYATAWRPLPVDRRLAEGLRPLLADKSLAPELRPWATWAEAPTEAEQPFAKTEQFLAEHAAFDAGLPAAERTAANALRLELEADFLLQREWWYENAAKQDAWERRFSRAEDAYRRLIAIEPGNEEALFDLAQVEAAEGLGREERATLVALLALDPNHTLANAALRRRDIRSAPLAAVEGRLWREHGRGDLASLQRSSVAAEVQDTAADAYNLRAGAELGRESPLTRAGAYAFRGASLEADGGFNRWISGSAGFHHREFYDPRIGHVDTGQAQLWLKHDAYGVGAGFERREEVANEFALFQGTRSDNFWLGGTAALTRRLDVDGRFTTTRYTDGNRGTSLVLRPAYAWTDHPRIFKTILTLEYRDTDAPTLYQRAADGRLTGLVHPYWTPRGYTHGALTFEWYHDLARQFFSGSEARYYDLRATVGTDSESNPALTLEADWHHEWRDFWALHAGAYVNWSREWQATGLQLRLSRRF